MIKIGSDIATWNKHIAINENEQLNSKITAYDFRAWEVELKRKSQHDLIPGTTSSVNDCTLALQTAAHLVNGMEADDNITWKGEHYSVIAVQAVRTALHLNGRDYVIYLKR